MGHWHAQDDVRTRILDAKIEKNVNHNVELGGTLIYIVIYPWKEVNHRVESGKSMIILLNKSFDLFCPTKQTEQICSIKLILDWTDFVQWFCSVCFVQQKRPNKILNKNILPYLLISLRTSIDIQYILDIYSLP